MTKKEKILLLDLILQDIRGNWGWDLEDRVDMALRLATDLNFTQFVDSILEYDYRWQNHDDNDGRFFLMHYSNGGYMNMVDLHGLDYTINDKSKEFQEKANVLTYPNSLFNDWEKNKLNKK